MTKKNIAAAITLCLSIALLTGCMGRSGNVLLSPSPVVSPSAADSTLASPDLSLGLQAAPDVDPNKIAEPMDNELDNEAQNSQSAQLEEARTLTAAAENILGIEEAAVIVTDDKKCIVALKLKQGTTLGSKIQDEIAAVANKDTQYRITSDKTVFEKIRALKQGMETGKSVSFEEVKDVWDKIQMASK